MKKEKFKRLAQTIIKHIIIKWTFDVIDTSVATIRMFSIVSRIIPYLLLLAFILSASFSVISCSAYLPIRSDISFISIFVNIGIILLYFTYCIFYCIVIAVRHFIFTSFAIVVY